ncbi:22875_t:CDS:2, partial [Cetraspora pellucida]
ENIKKVCQSYTLKEKANVVQYALHEGNLRAAAKFDLDKTQVGYWVMKLKSKLDEVDHSKFHYLEGGGRKSFFPNKEVQLYRWISEICNAALAVTYNSLKFEMLRIVSEMALKSNNLKKKQLASNFKAFSMWLKCFLKCYNLALRCKTKIAQKLPIDFEQQLLNFQRYDSKIYHNKILDNKTNEANENNPDINSGNFGENEENFKNKENNDATIEENENVLLFAID